MRPVQLPARGLDLRLAQRRAVGIRGALLVRRTETDHGPGAHQAGAVLVGAGLVQRPAQGLGIMAVDVAHHVPAVGLEPCGRIVAEPSADFPVDRDAVVVVNTDQLAEAQHAGQRAGFVRDALHQAAVTQQHPGPVVDDFMLRTVELGRQQPLPQRHAHRVGQALSKGPGGSLDTDPDVEFRVAGRMRAKLAERFQLVEVQSVAGQVRGAVQQHGSMSVGQHQPVAIHPVRLPRRHLEIIRIKQLCDVRHPHGHAGMAGVGALYGIHGQRAKGVSALPAGAGRD